MFSLASEIGNTHQNSEKTGGGQEEMGEGFSFFAYHIPHGQLDVTRLRFWGRIRGGSLTHKKN